MNEKMRKNHIITINEWDNEKKSSKNNKLMKKWGKNHKIAINKWITYKIIIK